VDPAESYPAKLQRLLDAKGYRYRVVNAGVSGDTSAQGLNRIDVVRESHPAIVILALGANDGLRGLPVKSTERNLAAIIEKLRAGSTRVVLAGMQMPPNYGPEYTAQFRAVFGALSRQYDLPLVPFLLEGVAANPDLNQGDGVHPTAAGYDVVTRNVWRVLEPLLERRPTSSSSG
jgi:acyl-CoA thioesterase-1